MDNLRAYRWIKGHIITSTQTIKPLLAASLCMLFTPHAALAADQWFLMTRHGECSPVASLVRTFSDIGSIAEPEAFIQFVRSKGLQVTSKAIPVQSGSAREVLVPARELSLMFVTPELCSRIGTR